MTEKDLNTTPVENENDGVENIEKIKKECEEYLEGWKRAKADLVNYKKEEEKRFEMIAKFSQESLMRDILISLDSFDLALISLSKSEDGQANKGLGLIQAQLSDILKKYGLEKVKVIIGDEFDPQIHEAISMEDSDKKSGTIIEEVEKGYTLHGRLIRPARVKVAK